MFSGAEQRTAFGTLQKHTVGHLVESQALTKVALIRRPSRTLWNQAVKP